MTTRRLLRRWRIVAVVVLLIVAALGLLTGYHGLAAMRIVRTHQAFAARLASGAVTTTDISAEFEALPADLAALQSHLIKVRRYGAPALWVMERAAWLPGIGADVQALPHVLDSGIAAVAAARAAVTVLPPVLEIVTGADAASGQTTAQLLLNVLNGNQSALQAMNEHLARAQAARSRVQGQTFHTPIGAFVHSLDTYLRLFDMAGAVWQALPAALGNERPQTYLLIAQNSDELRATGGFLSAAGTLTFDRGAVTDFSLLDSYAVDNFDVQHELPPEPLSRYMNIGLLLFRDVNWWPDFPTSAAVMMRAWANDRGQNVDGVIALDLEGMRLLLDGLGPVSVEGEAEPIGAEDLTQILRQKWGLVPEGVEEMGAWFLQRKDFWPLLASGVLAKAQGGLAADDLPRLARAVKSAIDGKHMQVYASDAPLQALVTRLGADGSLRMTRGDYLLIVDSNMGYNKVNPNIEQHIEYAIDLSNAARVQSALTISYTNNAAIRLPECIHGPAYGLTYEDMAQRCYWDYVRVYAPAGSTALLDDDGPDVEVMDDGGKRAFASHFFLAPGDSTGLRLRYLLAPGVVQQNGQSYHYALLVQKQGGTPGHALRVSVTLPRGSRLAGISPQPASVSADTLVFDVTLDRDRLFEVTYVR